MANIQILYPVLPDGTLPSHFVEEANMMGKYGFITGHKIKTEADTVIYRGFTIDQSEQYPTCDKMLQTWIENKKTLFMSEFLPVIEDLSIPTVFVDSLQSDNVDKILHDNNWKKVFIKAAFKSLFAVNEHASVYPDMSLDWISDAYSKRGFSRPFAIRQFIDDPEIFYNEQRYWVLNGNPYHPSGELPDFVVEAAKRLYKFSGSHYFTIDVAGKYIVEVNPGESSDRGGDNPLDFFCDIFAKEFLHNPKYNNNLWKSRNI